MHKLSAIIFTFFAISIGVFPTPVRGEEAAQNDTLNIEYPTLNLSIEEYTKMAVDRSIRSQNITENLQNSKWNWLSQKRFLSWPQLTATGSSSLAGSDNDLGTESETDSRDINLTLSQPLITETDLRLKSNFLGSDTETESGGVTSHSRTRTVPTMTAEVSQPLHIFRKNDRLRTWRINNIQWETTNHFYRSDILNIKSQAKRNYYELLREFENIQTERRKFASTNRLFNIAEDLFKQNKLSDVDLSRIEIREQEDARQISNVETTYTQRLNQAKDFILLNFDTDVILTTTLDYKPFVHELKDLTKAALQYNPSIQSSRLNVELSQISFVQSKEGNKPDFSLSGSYTKTLDRSDPSNDVDPSFWDARVNMNWTLFDATQTNLSKKQKEASLRNTRRTHENAIRQLRLSVENAFLDIKRIEGQITDFKSQMETSRNNLNSIIRRFKQRRANVTDVFELQDQVRDLEIEYTDLLVDYHLAVDDMDILLGGKLEFLKQ